MGRAPGFCGVILAAGESSRMGSDKALLAWPPTAPGSSASPGQTFLSAAIRSLAFSTDLVLVVVGENEAALAPAIYAEGAFLVRNPEPKRGQFSSLQVGLREVLNRGRDAAVITLVDRPPANLRTVEKLHDAFAAAAGLGKWAVVPEFEGKHGHPLVVGREMIEAFLTAPATATARDIEHRYQAKIEYVAVDDPLVAVNVNTPEDYAALRGR